MLEKELSIMNFLFFKRKNLEEILHNKLKSPSVKDSLLAGFLWFEEPQDIERWEKSAYDEWRKSLSDSERSSIECYLGYSYRDINDYLRSNELPTYVSLNSIKNHIANIETALKRTIIDKNIIGFRWIDQEGFNYWCRKNKIKKIKKGTVLFEKAFVSCNLIHKIPHEREKCDIVLVIKIPAGIKGAPVSLISCRGDVNEYEVLLNKGQKFIVEKILYKQMQKRIILCRLDKS
jgi:hypothetical protein